MVGMFATLAPVLSSLPCPAQASHWETTWEPQDWELREEGVQVQRQVDQAGQWTWRAEGDALGHMPPGGPCLSTSLISPLMYGIWDIQRLCIILGSPSD